MQFTLFRRSIPDEKRFFPGTSVPVFTLRADCSLVAPKSDHSSRLLPDRAIALAELGVALTQAQHWERAEAIWTEAETVIRTIEYNDERAIALAELGAALAQAHQWEQAKAVWSEAQAVIRTIEYKDERAKALRQLVITLAQAHQWEQAQAVIRTFENREEGDEALTQLGAEMVEVGEYEQLLHLIQRSCSLASTRDDAFRLFPLVTSFISRNPELGLALHEAFTWVDSFMKG